MKANNVKKHNFKPVNDHVVLEKKPNLSAVDDHPHYLLFDMLTHMRPHGSKTEQLFCDTYIAPACDRMDGFGNYHKVIGDSPKVLFSGHTDSVHHVEGFQNLAYDKEAEVLYSNKSSCLGADDATGVYIMLKMIEAGVEGHYIFHRGEEVGCLGSSWIVENTPEVMDSIDVAVAFDRKGTGDVITDQSTGKCASEEAGKQLSEMLNSHGLSFKPNPNGIYTDTAYYNGLVSECFNLSVGYYDQHTPQERQDLKWLTTFLEACLKLDWSSIESVRDTDDIGWGNTFGGFSWDRDWSGGDNGGYAATASVESILQRMDASPAMFAQFLSDIDLLSVEDLHEFDDLLDDQGLLYDVSVRNS